MDYQLTITIGSRGPAWLVRTQTVRAEIDYDLSSDSVPETIEGKLLGLTLDQIVALHFAENKIAGLEDRLYKFEGPNKDGSFELSRYGKSVGR